MKIINKNDEIALFRDKLAERSGQTNGEIAGIVSGILNDVRKNGDTALRKYCLQLDKTEVECFELPLSELEAAASKADSKLVETINKAAKNIRAYHEKQLSHEYEYELNCGGKILGRKARALKRVGVYIPGGTAAYPSTVLMDSIPASVAGVDEIILVTPPKPDGINPAVAVAALAAGVKRVFTVGGAQAIAALAFGTESVPRVDKIVGPGNIFVAEAKRQVFGCVDIDMIAGPSEVLVIADKNANAKYVAADMLSQAEHDVKASSILITDSHEFADMVSSEIDLMLKQLSRTEIAQKAIENYSTAIVVDSLEKAALLANEIAPEHLEIMTDEPEKLFALIENAGSVFIGEYTSEPLGDYFAGTNHVLPTNGSARFASPLSVDDFIKKMSYLSYSKEAFELEREDVVRFADAEGLTAHANAIKIRG